MIINFNFHIFSSISFGLLSHPSSLHLFSLLLFISLYFNLSLSQLSLSHSFPHNIIQLSHDFFSFSGIHEWLVATYHTWTCPSFQTHLDMGQITSRLHPQHPFPPLRLLLRLLVQLLLQLQHPHHQLLPHHQPVQNLRLHLHNMFIKWTNQPNWLIKFDQPIARRRCYNPISCSFK